MDPQSEPSLEEAGRAFLSGATYTEPAVFHAAAARLRRDDPVHRVEHPDFNPFYVISRHGDVHDIEVRHATMLNAPRAILGTKQADENRRLQGHLVTSLVQMDDPAHRLHRQLTAEWFLPKNLARLQSHLDDLARRSLDQMIAAGGRCDFAADIAMQFPLYVILTILGLPESDYPRMLQLTQELFGAEDPEYARDEDRLASLKQTVAEFVTYFDALTATRQAEPADDLASVIANGIIDGRPIGHREQLGYYIIVATAGHDTTSNSMSGGLLALIEHPEELDRLRRDPSLLSTAVDEMIRWTSPVKHFMRTATQDHEIAGTTVHAGEDVLLSYWSANFDDRVFTDPFRFDVSRSPNKHLAFGFGIHYCLGAMLARMELKAMFTALIPRLRHIELDGTPEWTRSTFVSGLKRLPVRYQLG